MIHSNEGSAVEIPISDSVSVGNRVTVTRIAEDLWQFNESHVMNGVEGPYVDAYLICGQQRALLVDCLQTCPDLLARVRKVTQLPIDVVITHGHGDHAGASLRHLSEAGCSIFMDLRDIACLNAFGGEPVPEAWFTPARDGVCFDLGGTRLVAFSVPGHTPGSLVLIDEDNQRMFSGDTIGSGHFWMQVPMAVALDRFLTGVEQLLEKTRNLPELLIYPGHRNQSPVQLTGQYVEDCVSITRGILSGEVVGMEQELQLGSRHMKFRAIAHGMYVSYCYDPDNLYSVEPGLN